MATFESVATTARSKVLRNEEFGYTKVVVERPLRQRYELNEYTRGALAADTSLAGAEAFRTVVLEAAAAETDWSTTDREVAAARTLPWFGGAGRVPKAVKDALLKAVSVSDPHGAPVADSKGELVPDVSLRETEYVPLTEGIDEYMARVVLPTAPDAWSDRAADKVGYEVPFTRLFFKYVPPRSLADIDADIVASQQRIRKLLAEVTE